MEYLFSRKVRHGTLISFKEIVVRRKLLKESRAKESKEILFFFFSFVLFSISKSVAEIQALKVSKAFP